MIKLSALTPLFLTLLLALWTAVVYNSSTYGTWHIYPALSLLPLVLLAHIALIVLNKPRTPYVIYAVGHLSAFTIFWVACLMLISKDGI